MSANVCAALAVPAPCTTWTSFQQQGQLERQVPQELVAAGGIVQIFRPQQRAGVLIQEVGDRDRTVLNHGVTFTGAAHRADPLGRERLLDGPPHRRPPAGR